MRVALTGATGFLGGVILTQLLDVGHAVKALARQPQKLSRRDGLLVQPGTLGELSALHALTEDTDVVVHAAGLVSAVTRQAFDAVNLEGTLNLAEAAMRNGVKRFVYISSLAASQPDLNGYAASKFQAEQQLARLQRELEIVVLRPSAIYGPADKATLPLLKGLLAHHAVLPGTAGSRFSMVHVQDAARAVVACAGSEASGRFDLSDGSGAHSWPELADIVRRSFGVPRRITYLPKALAMALGTVGDGWGRITGRPALINKGQMRQLYFPDWSVSENVWPLSAPIGLEEGLIETIRWYQDAGLLPLTPVPDRTPPDTTTAAPK